MRTSDDTLIIQRVWYLVEEDWELENPLNTGLTLVGSSEFPSVGIEGSTTITKKRGERSGVTYIETMLRME